MRIGMTEIIIIALIVLLLFGGKKIPELMKGTTTPRWRLLSWICHNS